MDPDQSGDSSLLSASAAQEARNPTEMSQLVLLASGLDSLRQERTLCDVTVTVDEKPFAAHKVVLAAFSSVFRAMFTGGLKESNQSEVVLQDDIDLSAEGFEILMDFAYTGRLRLTLDNVFEVLASACHLHVTQAIEGSIDFVSGCFREGRLSFDDYLKIGSMAGNYGLDRLKQVADHHIASSFGQVALTADFLEHMSAANLGQFLLRDDLAVSSEVQILEAVVSWLRYDPDNRLHHSVSLLKKVRLGLISSRHLVDQVDSSILAIPPVKVLYDQLMQHIALNSPVAGQLPSKHPKLFTPRVSTKALLAIGGQTTLGFTRYFCNQRLEWITLHSFPQLPFERVSHHALITVAGKLFLVGGVSTENDKTCTQNFFYSYDINANKWTRLRPMRVERSHVAVAHLDGYVYAIGGCNDRGEWLKTAERFDLARGVWQTVQPLPDHDTNSHPSAVTYEDRILVSVMDADWQRIYSFDPSRNQWSEGDKWHTINPGRIICVDGDCFLVCYYKSASKLGRKEERKHYPLVYKVPDSKPGSPNSYYRMQKLMPESDLRPFRIGSRVYLLVNGTCLDSHVEMQEGQVYDVQLDAWTKLTQNIEGAGIIEYTFNVQKFL